MKATVLALFVVLAASRAPGQANLGQTQRPATNGVAQPTQALPPGSGFSTGAQYAQVGWGPPNGGAYNQAGAQGSNSRQSRNRRSGAFYVQVSLAPRRR